jgi:sigma-E factor negative regulatory protein RseC
MIEEVGTVTKVEGIMASVAVSKKSSCDGCTAGGACKTTPEGVEIEAVNTIHAREGQTVRISMKPYTYIKGAMLIYGIPVVLLITGAIIGKNIGEEYVPAVNSDLVAAVMGFSFLFLSLIGIKIWSRNINTKTEYKPVIEEILNKQNKLKTF